MVARLEHLLDAVEEAPDVGLEQVRLLRPEEAEHSRTSQVERAIAIAMNSRPDVSLGFRRRTRGLCLEQRPPAAVRWIEACLLIQKSLGVGHVQRDGLDRHGPAHLLVQLEATRRFLGVSHANEALDVSG